MDGAVYAQAAGSLPTHNNIQKQTNLDTHEKKSTHPFKTKIEYTHWSICENLHSV